MRHLALGFCLGVLLLGNMGSAAEISVKAAVLRVSAEPQLPISRLDLPPNDLGFAGADLATADNASTGRFLGHAYETLTADASPEDVAAELDRMADEGVSYLVVLADAHTLLSLADRAAERDMLLFNASARDDRLRTAECRANLMHTAPSRAMIADGLAQYLVWKKWTDWILVHGSNPPDRAMAEAYRRAARKFGAEIVEEREFEDTGGARRSDSGHVLVQRQIPVFMQDAEDHDVVVAADESEYFAAYLPYRTWESRPVAGSAGLISGTWTSSHESFGATQLQRRFEKAAGRGMRETDYHVWLALRAVSEAVTRTKSADVTTVRDYLRSEEFQLAAFTGQGLSFRPWSNQLRHGIMLHDRRLLVSISPQEEFLHRRTRLDTLGFDEPETDCNL